MDQQRNEQWGENAPEENTDEEQAGPEGAEQSSEAQHDTTAKEPSAPEQGGDQQQATAGGEGAGDADAHKTLAIVGYILPFLFFLPLINEESKHNAFARFHANQQLILLIAALAIYILHSIFFRMFFMGGYIIMDIINLAYLVLVVIGIINAAKGEMKELPIVGGFQLLK